MPDIPYEVIDDDRGPRVIRGADLIGWTSEARDAESFARELNALAAENARLRAAMEVSAHDLRGRLARVGRLEAVEKAARDAYDVHRLWAACDVSLGTLYDAMERLRTALEATDE